MSSTYSITFLIPLYEETEEFNGILGRNDTEDSSPDSTAICESFEREKKMECIHYFMSMHIYFIK